VPNYAIDTEKQPMTATGIVEPVREWDETPEGKRRPSDRQARNELTGMPLWAVEVLYIQTAFGRESTVTAKVTVDSADEPRPAPLTQIQFEGLRVDVRVNKAGGFSEIWSAETVRSLSKAPAKPADKVPDKSADKAVA